MSQIFSEKVKDKINEDLSPTKNLTGLTFKDCCINCNYLVIISTLVCISISFIFNFGMFKGLPARAIHLGFALTLAFLIYPISKGKKISVFDILISLLELFRVFIYIFFMIN